LACIHFFRKSWLIASTFYAARVVRYWVRELRDGTKMAPDTLH
jgi:hypothetical protein